MASGTGGKSVARKFINFQQKSLMGRQSFKYRFEVVPYHVEGVAAGANNVILQWRRGNKLAETEPSLVDQGCHMAMWNKKLEQVATMYKQEKKFLSKDYTFKLQALSQQNGMMDRKTIGKAKVNFAQFCTLEPFTSKEFTLQMSPSGSVKLRISAQWLKNAPVDEDQVTDVSYMSCGSDDQDLDGFDTKENGSGTPGKSGRRARRTTAPASALARAQTVPANSMDSILEDITNESCEAETPQSHVSKVPAATPVSAHNRRRSASDLRKFPTTKDQGKRAALCTATASDAEVLALARPKRGQDHVSPNPASSGAADLCTPIAVETATGPPAPRHARSRSDGAVLFQIEPSPQESPIDKEHYLQMKATKSSHNQWHFGTTKVAAKLASSDDEDESNTPGWSNRFRHWFGSGRPSSALKTPHRSQRNAPAATITSAGCPIRPEQVAETTDAEELRQMAYRLIHEYELLAEEKRRFENKACKIGAKLEDANALKASLVERLNQQQWESSSQRQPDDLTAALVQSKLKLAEAEYSVLDLTGQLKKEKARRLTLMTQMTKLEAQYHVDWDAHFQSMPTTARDRLAQGLQYDSPRRVTME
eukprot:scaffold89076_cov32-Prasinocladus_malaysianus.AAC.1